MNTIIKMPLTSVVLFLLTFPSISFATGWQWMTPQHVSGLLKEGSGLWLVDVRSESSYAKGHIEGAINMPIGLLGTKRLPKGKIIVLADDSLGLRKGREAAEQLLQRGNERVYLLEGGMLSWQAGSLPIAGKGSAFSFSGVLLDDIDWALANHIPIRVLDLRSENQVEQNPVKTAQAVEGKDFAERLEKARGIVTAGVKQGLAAKIEKPPTTILVFPAETDPLSVLQRSFRGVPGDVRYLEGGYAVAVKPDRNMMSSPAACPVCPANGPGGKR